MTAKKKPLKAGLSPEASDVTKAPDGKLVAFPKVVIAWIVAKLAARTFEKCIRKTREDVDTWVRDELGELGASDRLFELSDGKFTISLRNRAFNRREVDTDALRALVEANRRNSRRLTLAEFTTIPEAPEPFLDVEKVRAAVTAGRITAEEAEAVLRHTAPEPELHLATTNDVEAYMDALTKRVGAVI